MRVRMFSTIIFLFYCITSNSQVSWIHAFGEPLVEEFALNSYPADPEAAGIVLYERGNYTVGEADGYIRLFKEVHRKVKVLDAKNFKHATVEILFYKEKNLQENITKFKAITHNGTIKKYVGEQANFDADLTENWYIKRFTFPDIKDGSILEYTYTIETPYLFNIGSWSFMEEIPTLYSELHTEIPGNYHYNRTLYGDMELDVNHAEIIKSCFHLPGFKVPGDCESATYAMRNIPAFKKEEYMLSEKNYMPSLRFELAKITKLDQTREVFSKTWASADKEFRSNKDLGHQLKYTSHFKAKIPPAILAISNNLERAKAVYYFMQSNMNWNKKYNFRNNIRVKEAFEKGAGNSSEINLSLINALEAAGIDAKIMAIATRDKAIPTKQYPVITDFNYAIVYVEIDNKKYFLDATEKYAQFGVLPWRALNEEGRVLDFKKGSFWEPIVGLDRNMHYVNIQMEAEDKGIFHGKASEVSTGQIALPKRKENNNFASHILTERKQSANESLTISNLKIENANDLEQPYKEDFNFTLDQQKMASVVYFHPFVLQTYFTKNPFSQKSRQYPIDFAYPITNNYLISIDVKEHYEIVKVPDNRILKLPENDGELSVVYETVGSKVNIRLNVQLKNTSYSPEANKSLSEFFEMLVKIQSQEPIELRRI